MNESAASGKGHGGGHGHANRHPMHQAMRSKAIGKIKKAKDVEGRVRAFLDDEVENFETLFAAASDPAVTKEQLLAEVRKAIEDRKDDIDEIVPFLATGQVQE